MSHQQMQISNIVMIGKLICTGRYTKVLMNDIYQFVTGTLEDTNGQSLDLNKFYVKRGLDIQDGEHHVLCFTYPSRAIVHLIHPSWVSFILKTSHLPPLSSTNDAASSNVSNIKASSNEEAYNAPPEPSEVKNRPSSFTTNLFMIGHASKPDSKI